MATKKKKKKKKKKERERERKHTAHIYGSSCSSKLEKGRGCKGCAANLLTKLTKNLGWLVGYGCTL